MPVARAEFWDIVEQMRISGRADHDIDNMSGLGLPSDAVEVIEPVRAGAEVLMDSGDRRNQRAEPLVACLGAMRTIGSVRTDPLEEMGDYEEQARR